MFRAETIPLPRAFHRSEEAAIAALEAIGAAHEPRFTMRVEVSEIGQVVRHFGVLKNVLADDSVDPALAEVLRPLVLRSGGDLVDRMRAGDIPYTPVTERFVHRVVARLHERAVHLPWSFQPMNLDLALRVSHVHRTGRLPFRIFYNQAIRIRTTNLVRRGCVELAGLFYLPVDGSAGGTWRPPAAGRIDPLVALVVEADAR